MSREMAAMENEYMGWFRQAVQINKGKGKGNPYFLGHGEGGQVGQAGPYGVGGKGVGPVGGKGCAYGGGGKGKGKGKGGLFGPASVAQEINFFT